MTGGAAGGERPGRGDPGRAGRVPPEPGRAEPVSAAFRLPGPVRELVDGPFPALGRWQEGRALWLAGAGAALAMEAFSVLWFQKRLGMLPCQYCVQIRFDMLAIVLGGLVAAAAPGFSPVRLAGWLMAFGAAGVGLKNSVALEFINIQGLHDPGFVSVCRPGRVDFWLGLKLDEWLPLHFRPSGACGEDTLWFLFDLSMTQWLIIFFVFAVASLSMVGAAGVLRRQGRAGAGPAARAGA